MATLPRSVHFAVFFIEKQSPSLVKRIVSKCPAIQQTKDACYDANFYVESWMLSVLKRAPSFVGPKYDSFFLLQKDQLSILFWNLEAQKFCDNSSFAGHQTRVLDSIPEYCHRQTLLSNRENLRRHSGKTRSDICCWKFKFILILWIENSFNILKESGTLIHHCADASKRSSGR